ncbi:hypothetical protein L210DRAFT_2130933 [Boletus edulis BED1]|uniref:Uncharacterized protein n=1 Tax=Boletus edulis BED1 TaxID=1328754 RepID=A0AAD4BE12_BOLED|nr:hypothetical protein L210DRAFT_2130933 [Boletus edulis BED1]
MSAVPHSIICETSNATVASICCTQLRLPVTTSITTMTIIPQSLPIPTGIPFTTCEWTASSNTTVLSEIESWLSCASTYANSTVNSACTVPIQSKVSYGIKIKDPVKCISMMVVVGLVVQMVLAI